MSSPVTGEVIIGKSYSCLDIAAVDDDDDGYTPPVDDDGDEIGIIVPGNFETGTAPEGAFFIDPVHFGPANTPSGAGSGALVVCGSTGTSIHSLATGAVVDTNLGSECTGGVPGPNSIFSFGPYGGFDQSFDTTANDWSWGQIFFNQHNITDTTLIIDLEGNLAGALFSDNTYNQISRSPVKSEGPGYGTASVIVEGSHLSGAGVTTSVVSACSQNGEGPFLAITDSNGSNNGHLVHIDPGTTPPTVTDVGEVGLSPRRVRCLDTGGTCIVSNYSSNTIQIIDWPNRTQAPTIRSEAVAVSGPVGVDIKKIGESVFAVATGFNDNTFHPIKIEAATATDTSQALTNCTGPGHATFLGGGSHIAVTCNTNARLVILEHATQ